MAVTIRRACGSAASGSRGTRSVRSSRALGAAAAAAVGGLAMLGSSARAATLVWDGGAGGTGTVLQTAANWNPDAVPSTVNADILRFDGVVAGPLLLGWTGTTMGAGGGRGVNFELTANQVGAVTIDSGATTNAMRMDNLTIAPGAGPFTFGDGAGATNLTFGNLSGQTHTWTNDSSNAATIASDVVFAGGGAGTHTLVVTGSGDWLFNNNVSQQTQSGSALSVTKRGTGTATLANATNGYLGATTVEAGTLNINGSTGTGAVIVAGGVLNLAGTLGTNTTNANFRVGTVVGVPAVLNFLPTASATRHNLFVGDATAGPGGVGAVYQTGGSMTLTQGAGVDNFRVGSSAGGYGYYSLSGGSLTANEFAVGAHLAGTVGVMDVTGGFATSNGFITIGRGGTTSSGLLNVIGGGVNAARIHLNFAAAAGATSVLNVGGGVEAVAVSTAGSSTIGLEMAHGSGEGTLGVVNLRANGTLTTGLVSAAQAAPTALLNFTGGTLQAAFTNAGATFMTGQNVDAVTVYGPGGTIHNSGTNITIGANIVGATGDGANANPVVSAGGAGYVGAPLVTVNGPGGRGATAYATVANGQVTGIVVTSPGTGYTGPLTFTLTGGGGTGAAVADVTPTANTAGGLTFVGAGTTTIAGAVSYTAPTVINDGRLSVTGSIAGPVTLNQGSLDGTGTVGATTVANNSSNTITNGAGGTDSLTLASLAFNGGGTISANVSAAATPGVIVTGALTTTPAGGLVIVNAFSPNFANGLNNLVGFGSLNGSLSDFSLGSVTGGLTGRQTVGNLVLNGSNLAVQINGDSPVWTGRNGGLWTTAPTGSPTSATPAWALKAAHTETDFWASDTVEFNDTVNINGAVAAPVTTTATIAGGPVGPLAITFNNSTLPYTIRSDDGSGITGNSTLTKNGLNTVTIDTANSYTGFTAINEGTVILNGQLNGTPVTVAAGAVLAQTAGSLIGGPASITSAGTVNLAAQNAYSGPTTVTGGTFTLTGGLSDTAVTVEADGKFDQTDTGVIGGLGGSFTSAGTSTLAGVNGYLGATNVTGGTTTITGTLGDTAVRVSGGTLTLSREGAINQRTLTITGDGTLVETVDNAVGGSASLIVQKSLTLDRPHNYSGDTTINGGTGTTLTVIRADAAGTGRFNMATGSTNAVLNLHIDGGGRIVLPNYLGGNSGVTSTIDVNNNGDASTNGVIVLNGTPSPTAGLANHTLNVTGGNGYSLEITGLLNHAGAAGTTTLNPTTAKLTIGTYGSATNNTKTLVLGGTAEGNAVTGVISNGSAGTVRITKSGTSTWTLAGENTYTGPTLVNEGTLTITGKSLGASAVTLNGDNATLRLESAGAISAGSLTLGPTGTFVETVPGAITGTASFMFQRDFTLDTPRDYSGETTISGGTDVTVTVTRTDAAGTGGRFNFQGNATSPLNPTFALHVDGGGTIAFPQYLGGSSGVTATIDVDNNGDGSQNGVILLNGTPTTAGIGGMTLNVTGGNGYSLSLAALNNSAGGAGTNKFNPTTANLTIGTYTSSSTAAKVLELGGTSQGNAVTGVISNGSATSVAVTKSGASTWTLAGANTYTGATNVTDGNLIVTGTLGATSVNVSGGTLTLSNPGAINAGPLTVSGAGTLVETVDDAINGTASLVVQKDLTLSRPHNYSGTTTINAGTNTTLTVTHRLAAGTNRFNFATGATTPVLNLHIDGGGRIELPNYLGASSGMTATVDVNNNGDGSQDGVIVLAGAPNPANGIGNALINVTGGNGYALELANLITSAGAAGTTTLNPTTARLTLGGFSSSTNSAKTLQLDGTRADSAVTGTIADGSAGTVAVRKSNTGTWTLGGVNTYSGATTVTDGTLRLNGVHELSGTYAVTGAGRLEIGTTGTVVAGTFNSEGPVTVNGALTTNGGGTVARLVGTGTTTVGDGVGLTVALGAPAAPDTLASRVASEAGELSPAGSAYVDLTNNDLVIRGSDLADGVADSTAAFAAVISGRGTTSEATATKEHNGPGLRSVTAKDYNATQFVDVLGLTAVLNGDLNLAFNSATTTKSTFGGLDVTPDDTLVRFGMIADLNFDGAITSQDYFAIDQAFLGRVLTRSDNSVVTGPLAGDLTGDGQVNASDYFLIDQAFLRQGGVPIDAMVEFQRAAFGDEFVAMAFSMPAGAVPEPATLSLLALGATALLGRRRRK